MAAACRRTLRCIPTLSLVALVLLTMSCASRPTAGLKEVEAVVRGIQLPTDSIHDEVRTAFACDDFEPTERGISRIVTYDRDMSYMREDIKRQMKAAGLISVPPRATTFDRFERQLDVGVAYIETRWNPAKEKGIIVFGGVDGDPC